MVEIVRNYFIIPEDIEAVEGLGRIFIDNKPDWVCWQTGLELRYMETTLFSLRQVLHKVVSSFDYYAMKVVIKQDENATNWSQIELSSILEVIMVINLVGAYVSSAKYTRRGVKVVYLGFVGTGESL